MRTAMREAIFRGKRVSDNQWVYGSLIKADDFCCILENEEDVHPMDYPYLDGKMGIIDGKATPVDPETVGQWTGLVDKNGKKIFEGDVVITEFGRKCVVQWLHLPGFCGWDLLAIPTHHNVNMTRPPRPNYLYASVCLEVLGNRFDNHEFYKE